MTAWLLDTGPLVAFFDRSDAGHEWAKEQWAQAPVPMLTCEAVLAEAAYLLREHAGLPGEKRESYANWGSGTIHRPDRPRTACRGFSHVGRKGDFGGRTGNRK